MCAVFVSSNWTTGMLSSAKERAKWAMRYGDVMTGRTTGLATGRKAGRRGDGTTSRTEDGTKIAYPSDGKNVYEFRFD